MEDLGHFIWFEKYRPKTLDEMALPNESREAFESYLESKNIPHLMLYGAPGSGKTTIAQIIIDELPCVALSINASSKDRGIDTMTGRVRDFAASKPPVGKPLKIVFLDEADGLTAQAQDSLKNTMEKYSGTCRFILTANNDGKITDAIKSRCTQFYFNKFPVESMVRKVQSVLRKEKVTYEKEAVEALVNTYYPDFRSIINNLQMASVSGEFKPSLIAATNFDYNSFCKLLKKGKIKSLREMWAGNSDFTFIYKTMFDRFLQDHVGDEQKPDIAIAIADYMRFDNICLDREINLTACCVAVAQIIGKVDFNG